VLGLPAEGETVTNDYLKRITNEDAEAQLRDPVLWAYILRDPTGAICSIKSLHERGLLDANFSDQRVLRGEFVGVQNLDGARHEHSPEIPEFQVWTSALGRKVLKDKGLLLDDNELRYH
jgi:hypothetical protein